MKKAFVFLLIPVFLLNSSLNELFKLPVVYSHFMEHRQQDQALGIGDFLVMHYFGNDLNDNDEERDMQLPFKKINGVSSFEIAVTAFSQLPFLKKQVFFEQQTLLPSFNERHCPDPAIGNVFKPPIG